VATADFAEGIAAHLVCPRCHRSVDTRDGRVRCGACGAVGSIVRDVVSFENENSAPVDAYFDDRVHELNVTTDYNWGFSYAQQVALLSPYLQRAGTVLDVGCGSRLAYEPRPDTYVIGVDPSIEALHGNRRLDLRVHASAVRLPVASSSVDLLVCFYSLHHMIGASVRDTQANVTECLRECARVLAPDGVLFIAENNPRTLFWPLQRYGWRGAKRLLGRHVDMFFWSRRELNRLLVDATGRQATRTVECDTGPLTVIAPLFAVPRFKVFRFMFPLECSVSIWQKP
jgi:SAM-dependent methyltransferase